MFVFKNMWLTCLQTDILHQSKQIASSISYGLYPLHLQLPLSLNVYIYDNNKRCIYLNHVPYESYI